ncbi:hypothetical protein Bbelb_205620 [Branchiostoma belcheri]|nr:hypothetical protein Bbelb_205620 [Branchiostoma belcheri]
MRFVVNTTANRLKLHITTTKPGFEEWMRLLPRYTYTNLTSKSYHLASDRDVFRVGVALDNVWRKTAANVASKKTHQRRTNGRDTMLSPATQDSVSCDGRR